MSQCPINQPGDQRNLVAALFASTDAAKLVDAGDIEEGIALFDRAIEICPPGEYHNDLCVLRGAALTRIRRTEAALADFDQAVKYGCAYPNEALRRRGNALALLGRYEDALEDFCQALAEGEDPSYAHQRIIGLLVSLGRDDEAAHVPIDGLKGKDDAPFRLALVHAELCLLMDDPATAAHDVARADAIGQDDDAELALWRAVLRRRLGLEPTTPAIRSALDAAPEHWGTAAFSWLIRGEGSLDTVCGKFTPNDLPGDRAEIRCILHWFAGVLAETAGDVAGALAQYRAAQGDPDAQWLMEYVLAGRGLCRLDQRSDAAFEFVSL